jgi:hypothetical protein
LERVLVENIFHVLGNSRRSDEEFGAEKNKELRI